MKNKQHIYFPGLNGLRSIFIFLIIISHIEQFKMLFRLNNLYRTPFFSKIGDVGVTFFFVLTGFLTTYLLLAEKKRYHKVAIGKYYIRRILRILPLYYLMVILSLFLFPHISFLAVPTWTEKIYYFFPLKVLFLFVIFPHLSSILFSPIPFISQSWAIGVQEQFYFLWPLILKLTRKYLLTFLTIILLFIIFSNSLVFLSKNSQNFTNYKIIIVFLNISRDYLKMFRISCMSIGAIGAYLLFYRKTKILQIIYRVDIQIITLILIVFLVLKGISILYINHEVYSILFGILILNISTNQNSIINLEKKMLNFLGKISYGLYMYHSLAIVLSIKIIQLFIHNNYLGNISNLSLYLLSISLTALFATISFNLFERRFLRLKTNFSKITSG